MQTPSSQIALFDTEGEAFGYIRIAADPDREDRLDCIFDVEPTNPAQALRSEVRWLLKRHFQRYSEHRLQLLDDGGVKISKADFTLWLDPDEDAPDALRARPPAPGITAVWEED